MSENPYQPPSSIDLSTEQEPKHRSFRLTMEPMDQSSLFQVGNMRQAIEFSLITQLPILVFVALVLDGGGLFRTALVATIAFWIWTILIFFRKRGDFPDSDILVVKWGYLPLILIVYNSRLILNAITG